MAGADISSDRFLIFLGIVVYIILQVRNKEFLKLLKMLKTHGIYQNLLKKDLFR